MKVVNYKDAIDLIVLIGQAVGSDSAILAIAAKNIDLRNVVSEAIGDQNYVTLRKTILQGYFDLEKYNGQSIHWIPPETPNDGYDWDVVEFQLDPLKTRINPRKYYGSSERDERYQNMIGLAEHPDIIKALNNVPGKELIRGQ